MDAKDLRIAVQFYSLEDVDHALATLFNGGHSFYFDQTVHPVVVHVSHAGAQLLRDTRIIPTFAPQEESLDPLDAMEEIVQLVEDQNKRTLKPHPLRNKHT